MKTLNLDPSFHPYGQGIPFECFTFPGGEPHIRITGQPDPTQPVMVTTRIRSFEDMGVLVVAVDALKRLGVTTINLLLPYFPAARQDRLMAPGEALTVQVYADLINQLGFNRVTIFDPHSDVAPALIHGVEVVSNHRFVQHCLRDLDEYVLIAPDAGATKKIYPLARQLGNPPVVECAKTRDPLTGQLSGFHVHSEDLHQATCVVVDDICDGGGTFLGIAKALKEKNAGKLILVVSHGIFSKNLVRLQANYSAIYTTDSFQYLTGINQIPLTTTLLNQSI